MYVYFCAFIDHSVFRFQFTIVHIIIIIITHSFDLTSHYSFTKCIISDCLLTIMHCACTDLMLIVQKRK